VIPALATTVGNVEDFLILENIVGALQPLGSGFVGQVASPATRSAIDAMIARKIIAVGPPRVMARLLSFAFVPVENWRDASIARMGV
jgi:hypothetical protein